MTLPNDVFTTWLPLALTALLALLGLLRGLGREMVVAAAINLGALIVQQWGDIWGRNMNELINTASPGWSSFVLGVITLFAVTILIGYVLGSRLVERPNSSRARLLGFLLGAMNGAALAGWSLRYGFVGLDAAQPTSPLYRDAVSQGFMIWAGWFPVVIALLGILYALLAPLRRAQDVIERPAAGSDWDVPTSPTTDSRAGTLSSRTGSETVALPVSASSNRPSVAAATTALPTDTTNTAIWDKPRVTPAAVEPRDFAPADDSTQEASWLGGKGDASTSDSPNTGDTIITRPASSVIDAAAPDSEQGRVCAHCGADLLPDATFCTNCGTRAT